MSAQVIKLSGTATEAARKLAGFGQQLFRGQNKIAAMSRRHAATTAAIINSTVLAFGSLCLLKNNPDSYAGANVTEFGKQPYAKTQCVSFAPSIG